MLNSAFSGVGVDSVSGKSRYSVDRGGSAELNAPISVAVEPDPGPRGGSAGPHPHNAARQSGGRKWCGTPELCCREPRRGRPLAVDEKRALHTLGRRACVDAVLEK
jgi:hypothetical protein